MEKSAEEKNIDPVTEAEIDIEQMSEEVNDDPMLCEALQNQDDDVEHSLKEIVLTWENKILEYTELYKNAIEENDLLQQKALMGEIDRANRNIIFFKKSILSLVQIRDSKESTETKKIVARVGLSLTRKDLPKYQLASSRKLPFPECEAFDSEEHFLRTFEKVVYSAGVDVEEVWDKYLPLCIHSDHDPWIEEHLKKCKDWAEARGCFIKKFTTQHRARESTTMVFTMLMRDTESVTQYTSRFLRAVNDASLDPKDTMLAERFLASLTQSVQVCTRIALYGRSSTYSKFTIEEVAEVARDILGDNYRNYVSEAAIVSAGLSITTGTNGNKRMRFDTNKQSSSSRDPRLHQSKFCKQHGWNKSHSTIDCFSNKKPNGKESKPVSSSREKKCFYCDQPWNPKHRCQQYVEKKSQKNVLAIHTEEQSHALPESNRVESKQSHSPPDPSEEEIEDALMNDIDFDCKFNNETDQNFKLITPIYLEGIKLLAKIDTGSDISCLNMYTFKNILHLNKIIKIDGTLYFASEKNATKRIGQSEPLSLSYINNITFKHKFEIVKFSKELHFDVLLGADILNKMGIGLTGVAVDWKKGKEIYSQTMEEDELFQNLNIDHKDLYEADKSPAGTKEQREKFMKIIQTSIDNNQKIPNDSFCTIPESIVYLPTKEGATAYQRQYPIEYTLRPILDKQIEDWLKSGTIRQTTTNTSFNSPLLLVPKRNKSGEIVAHRVCTDVRGLNRLLPDLNFPVPLVREIFDNLAGKRVFTTLDLKSAYNRFLVNPDDQHKLTFTHNNKQFCFQGCCFGIKTVTSLFCKVMAILFDDMKDIVQTFVDDCIVSSSSIEQHAIDVKRVIDKLTSVNLILNPDKCSWFQHSVTMLGFVVNSTGVKVDPKKLTNVESWPIPKTSKEVQRFMGLICYFRDFIPMISDLAAPIDRLRNEPNVSKHWTNLHTERFNALKKILQSKHVLHYVDLSQKLYVATDASLYGAAAVLYQKDEQGRTKHIAFVSKSLSPSQRNWSTTKRELFAIILALKRFRVFLWGRHFEIQCDHKALVYMHLQKKLSPMLIGWLETILDFNFKITHIKGMLNILPDELSRLYPPRDESKLAGNGVGCNKYKARSKKAVHKKKAISKDKRINLLAVKLQKNKKATLDYICPPDEVRDDIMNEAHEFGHFGSESIVQRIHADGMHWTNMYEDAKETVKACPECQKHNITRKGYHPLVNIVAYAPFDHIALDLAGPLTVSTNNNVYLLVLVDICTRYTILRAIPNKQSDTIARNLVQIFGDYGFPKIVSSDNGTEFKNALQHKVSLHLGIDRRYTTAYHPQANGSAESTVKIAMNTIRKMCKSNSQDWDHYLPIVQLSINYKIRNRTNTAPFSLMFARTINKTKDYSSKDEVGKLPSLCMSEEELLEKTEKMEKIVFPAIKERTEKIIEKYSEKYNKRKMMVDIDNGTHVMIKFPHRQNKLAPLYEGPYTVVRRTTGGSYILKDEQNELLHRDYTPSELKVITVDEKSIEDEYYTVEEIRDHKGEAGNRQYLVKWAGYGERSNTWEPASNFSDPTIVHKYWEKRRRLKELEKDKEKSTLSNKRGISSNLSKRKHASSIEYPKRRSKRIRKQCNDGE